MAVALAAECGFVFFKRVPVFVVGTKTGNQHDRLAGGMPSNFGVALKMSADLPPWDLLSGLV